MTPTTTIEAMLRRDRAIIVAGLVLIAALAWAYMVWLAQGMGSGDAMGPGTMAMSMSMSMSSVMSWTLVDFVSTFVMWAVMMVAMMTPAAAPMVLIYASVNRQRRERQQPFVSAGTLLTGYLIVWWGFALAATLAQWGLHQTALLSAMMGNVTPVAGGAILVAAGVFQWTPLKYACLKHCRSPLGHLMAHWREGRWGTLYLGLDHGLFCLGCCWVLMALMFVAGVMNLVWMAAIAAYVLLEKVAPLGRVGNTVTWAAGLGMVAWGGWMIASGLV